MKYQPRLDGIRSVAVLLVFAFHATHLLPGGWIGVDIFFVLSGYLITSLLSQELGRTGRVDLPRFFAHRALRLVPALLITVVISIPLMLIFNADRNYPIWAVTVGVIGYAANWMQVAHPTSLGPLTHTWSLAIEEQFYLVWPFALLLFTRIRARAQTKILWVGAAVIVLAVTRAALAGAVPPASLWFASTSRADSLLIGALLAIATVELGKRSGTATLVLSAFVLGATALVGSEFSGSMLLGGLTLVAVAAAGLITGAQASPLGRVLEWRPLVAAGRVSYGIYLYHYPVFFLANNLELTGAPAWGVKILGTSALVLLSWFFVERPILALKNRRRQHERAPRVFTGL